MKFRLAKNKGVGAGEERGTLSTGKQTIALLFFLLPNFNTQARRYVRAFEKSQGRERAHARTHANPPHTLFSTPLPARCARWCGRVSVRAHARTKTRFRGGGVGVGGGGGRRVVVLPCTPRESFSQPFLIMVEGIRRGRG